MTTDEPGRPESEAALDALDRTRLGEEAGDQAGAAFGDWQGNDLRKPEQALAALREIEKTRLTLEAIERSDGHFLDTVINSLHLVGDLATDAIGRAEAAKRPKDPSAPTPSDSA